MSSRLFQGFIHQMKDVVERTFGVIDSTGTIIACSELGRIGEPLGVQPVTSADIIIDGGYTLKLISADHGENYTVFVEGSDVSAGKFAALIAISFSNIKNYYDEKYDKSSLIKNIILDNILPGDIYLKARELYFNSDVLRTVIIVRNLDHNDLSVYDVLQNLFPDKNKDFIISINETDIVLVKEIFYKLSHPALIISYQDLYNIHWLHLTFYQYRFL